MFADSRSRYGCRGIEAALRTGVSGKAVRGIMAGGGLVAHAPERRGYGSCGGGETTRAPGSLADRGFTAGRPNGKWLTDVTGIRAGDGKGVPLAAGRLPRRQDRRACRRVRSRRGAGRPDAGGSGCRAARGRASPGALRPRRASPDGWRSRPSTTEKWEERPRGEVLALIDEYIHWHDHERIKQSPGWMSPVQYRQSQGTAA